MVRAEASQRATVRMLGVGKDTVARDLGTRDTGAHAPPPAEEPKQDGPSEKPTGAHDYGPPSVHQHLVDPLKRTQGDDEPMQGRRREDEPFGGITTVCFPEKTLAP